MVEPLAGTVGRLTIEADTLRLFSHPVIQEAAGAAASRHTTSTGRLPMDVKEMKKVLAGLGIATLMTTAGAAIPGHLHGSSG